jgi:hypothetical protein
MAFAAVAAKIPGVRIEDPGCVAKTYPGFWDDLAGAGLRWRTIGGAASATAGSATAGRVLGAQQPS